MQRHDSVVQLRQDKIKKFIQVLSLIMQAPEQAREKLTQEAEHKETLVLSTFDQKDKAEHMQLLINTMMGLQEDSGILSSEPVSDNPTTYTLTLRVNKLSNDELDAIDKYNTELIDRLADFMNLLNYPGCWRGIWENVEGVLYFRAFNANYLQSLNLNNQLFEANIKTALTALCKMNVFNKDINAILSDTERAIFATQYGNQGSGLLFRFYRLWISPFYLILIKAMNTLIPKQNVIPSTDLDIQRRFNGGCFGDVSLALYKNRPIVVKNILSNGDDEPIKSLVSERRSFEFLHATKIHGQHHPGEYAVIQYLGYTSKNIKGAFGVLMEYADKASLDGFVNNNEEDNEEKKMTPTLKKQFMVDIAHGLSYLHHFGIIHRDLKTENVVVCSVPGKPGALHAKIIDLGGGRHKNDQYSKKDIYCTPYFSAPEVLQQQQQDEKSDVFSMGVIDWEIMMGRTIGTGYHPKIFYVFELANRVAIKGERAVIPNDCPVKISTIIKRCWEQEPEKRPSAADCVTVLQAITDEEMRMPNGTALSKLQ